MRLIADLNMYLNMCDERQRAKTGVKLLERCLLEISRLYQVADQAHAVVSTRDQQKRDVLLRELEAITDNYFAVLSDAN